MRRTLVVFVTVAVALACGSSSEHVGTPCSTAAMCFPMVDGGAIRGTVTCLTKYPGGYCTHTCTADTDCCAVPNECKTGFKQVCAPFENQPQQYCFLSCEGPDIAASPNGGVTDPNAYCNKFFFSGSTCRSTGGGSSNRKICG